MASKKQNVIVTSNNRVWSNGSYVQFGDKASALSFGNAVGAAANKEVAVQSSYNTKNYKKGQIMTND